MDQWPQESILDLGPKETGHSYNVPVVPVSMVAELHAIEEALFMPQGSMSVLPHILKLVSIPSQPGPPKLWECNRLRWLWILNWIHHHLSEYTKQKRGVYFQHIYSHITQKASTAAAKGDPARVGWWMAISDVGL